MHQYLTFLCIDWLNDTTWPCGVLRTLPRWNLKSQQLIFICSDFRVPISVFIWLTCYACYEETVVWWELVVVVLYEVTTSGMT
jgi:hypothetical protein